MRVLSAGRFAREAAARGPGEVCAVFARSFYLRFPGGGYACVGERSIGNGPLNVLAESCGAPALHARLRLALDAARPWVPPPLPPVRPPLALDPGGARPPAGGLGVLAFGAHNALCAFAQPALEALDAWLAGRELEAAAERLIGLGPGLTPSGDDYLGGILVALHIAGRPAKARDLWRWLAPRLAARTSGLSAAHLAAAAHGEAHESLHACIAALACGDAGARRQALEQLSSHGRFSGWDALAGARAVLRCP